MMDGKNPSEDPRLPKKQRRRDENPPDDLVSGRPPNTNMDCDTLPSTTATPPVSYKGAVNGGSTASDGSVLFDDDDFDLLDEDVNCGIKDGVPFIDFS
ncbi:hypothetical protein V6N11_002592 [Hibiscus sabdariffa]|uniref:Uncharacterized protein n=1 Tax=Hibiscus sabdariffa TaxID=183260 RepID=A0ABR2SAM7_9ROSI